MAFDPKLIPLFDGTDSGQSVVEWVEKAELVCRLSGVKRIECVVPMRLSGGAYAVYQQLSEEKKSDFTCIKTVLYTAFALDAVTAWKQFVARRLRPGETVDVFLAELRKLSVLVGGMTDRSLMCAFIAGLPEHAEDLLRATFQLDDMDISQVLARARAILKKCPTDMEQVAVAAQPSRCQTKEDDAPTKCYVCNGPNHFARDCLLRRDTSKKEDAKPRRPVSCYRCKRQGHIARNCPGNEQGDETSAPVFSPNAY